MALAFLSRSRSSDNRRRHLTAQRASLKTAPFRPVPPAARAPTAAFARESTVASPRCKMAAVTMSSLQGVVAARSLSSTSANRGVALRARVTAAPASRGASLRVRAAGGEHTTSRTPRRLSTLPRTTPPWAPNPVPSPLETACCHLSRSQEEKPARPPRAFIGRAGARSSSDTRTDASPNPLPAYPLPPLTFPSPATPPRPPNIHVISTLQRQPRRRTWR